MSKKLLLKRWTEEKNRLKRQLYKDDIHDDDGFILYATQVYDRLRPLLLRAFLEDYPDDEPTPGKIERWLQNCAIASNALDLTRDRNEWTEFCKFHILLYGEE